MNVNPTENATMVLSAVAGEVQARSAIQMELIKESMQAQARIAEMLLEAGIGQIVDLHV